MERLLYIHGELVEPPSQIRADRVATWHAFVTAGNEL